MGHTKEIIMKILGIKRETLQNLGIHHHHIQWLIGSEESRDASMQNSRAEHKQNLPEIFVKWQLGSRFKPNRIKEF